LLSSPRSRVLHPAPQVATVLPRVVRHVARPVSDPAARAVHPVRPRRAPPHEVVVQPRGARQGRHGEPARGEDGGGHDKHQETDRDPHRARQEDDGAEEGEGHDGASEGEDEEDAAGEDEGEEADDLVGAGCVAVEPAEEAWPAGGGEGGGPRVTRRHCPWACWLPLCHGSWWKISYSPAGGSEESVLFAGGGGGGKGRRTDDETYGGMQV
ncbi:hypothetical protein BHM03_00049518, partial [Ensete ventricosum]